MRDLADCFVHLDRGDDRLLVVYIRPPCTEKEAEQMGEAIDSIVSWLPLVRLSRVEYYDMPPKPLTMWDRRRDHLRRPAVVDALAKRRDIIADLYAETGDTMWRQRGDEYNTILALLVNQRLIPPKYYDDLLFRPGGASE